ncbi:MAG: cupredoxin domain-containing protein [Solirubrobacterales bacterium]|nr:cupredoxin domain-containing protein [Solirubrobacterales bacterium]MBV9717657.1 cupredoxin domain-containing protein [Solirubrobacterales bacterium]
MGRFLLPLVAALSLAAAGCGSSSSSPTTAKTSGGSPSPTSSASYGGGGGSSTGSAGGAGASGGQTVNVTMRSLAFSPSVVHVKVGETVVWTNDDGPPHNVTYVSGPKFTSSPTMNPGATFRLKLTQAGTVHYYCSIHPFMKASIVVSP